MPNDGKVCSFDCLYCEAGFNAQGPGSTGLPSREKVRSDLEAKLAAMKEAGEELDVITFSGNGEPTLHPDFPGIVDDTLELRDRYYPRARVSVLSNSTRLGSEQVAGALRRVDNNILKLDSAIESTMQAIDRPAGEGFTVDRAIEWIKQFSGECIVQTMLLRGTHDGKEIDNTTPAEVEALIAAYKEIKPRQVMLYSIDRATPATGLHKVSHEELEEVAARVRAAGIDVTVS